MAFHSSALLNHPKTQCYHVQPYSPVFSSSPPLSVSQHAFPPTQDTPLWTLTDWSTDFTLPDGGSVIFRISNTLTEYGALCFRRGALPEGQCIWVDGGTESEDDDT